VDGPGGAELRPQRARHCRFDGTGTLNLRRNAPLALGQSSAVGAAQKRRRSLSPEMHHTVEAAEDAHSADWNTATMVYHMNNELRSARKQQRESAPDALYPLALDGEGLRKERAAEKEWTGGTVRSGPWNGVLIF